MFSKKSMQQTKLLLGYRNRLATKCSSALFASQLQTRSFASAKDNFMSGANANYIDYMYSQWQ